MRPCVDLQENSFHWRNRYHDSRLVLCSNVASERQYYFGCILIHYTCIRVVDWQIDANRPRRLPRTWVSWIAANDDFADEAELIPIGMGYECNPEIKLSKEFVLRMKAEELNVQQLLACMLEDPKVQFHVFLFTLLIFFSYAQSLYIQNCS